MKRVIVNLAVTALLCGAAGIGAQSATEPLSGLPLAPGFTKTGDPVQSYKYCAVDFENLCPILDQLIF